MARFLLLFLVAYVIWCTTTTESANLSVKELSGVEYLSVTGLSEERVSSNQNERQITERLPSGERTVNLHRKVAEFYLDYADPQPNKDHASSVPHARPPLRHV